MVDRRSLPVRYLPIKTLDEGGQGAVISALDLHTGKPVAVKFWTGRSPEAMERAEREVRLLRQQVDNKYVVDVFEADFGADPPYVVMELCSASLRSWVKNRRPWPDVVLALIHATLGLRGLHRVNGFHRDIKPDNLLIAKDTKSDQEIIKLADFGFARVPMTGTPMTRDGYGTPGYFAPEILTGRPFTPQADVYSLGVVGAELLTGTTRLEALDDNAAPEPLKALLRRMTEMEPTKRPTIEMVARELLVLMPKAPPTAPKAPTEKPKAAQPIGPKPGAAPFVQPPFPAPRGATEGGGGNAAGFVAAVLGGAVVAAGLAALLGGNSKEWDDAVGRYRGPDGRFKK